MADGRDSTAPSTLRSAFPWMEIFQCFTVALDPRKLLVAAAGILVMSFAWWFLSVIFFYQEPTRGEAKYGNDAILNDLGQKKKPGTNDFYTVDDAKIEGDKRFTTDHEQWAVLASLAGPGGRLRTLPWYEYRGPNPFMLITNVISGSAGDRHKAFDDFLYGTVPVLVEPLMKLLLPVAKFFTPGVSPLTQFYLILILLTNIAVWAFCGGVITRLAAVQLANKGPISLRQAVIFVKNRYLGYLGAPAVPLAIIAAVIIGLFVLGVVGMIPVIGDLFVYGIGLPLIIFAGAIMAVFLVGLVGYPLMYTTLSAEGDQSDTFDALSRSLNYVYSRPWHYIWYWLVAISYGAAVTLFVIFFTSLAVYAGKWAVGIPASWVWSDRKPEFLFIYAPDSFGWRELLTKDSPYAVKSVEEPVPGTDRIIHAYPYVNEADYNRAKSDYNFYNNWGAGLVCFWLTGLFLFMLGFTYSFFWTAATMIYFLMRKKVDEAELDEVFIEEEEPVAPPAPPKIAEGTSPTSLPVISAPTPPPPTVPPVATIPPTLPPIPLVESPPAPPLPFSPPATVSPPTNGEGVAHTEEKKSEEPPPSSLR